MHLPNRFWLVTLVCISSAGATFAFAQPNADKPASAESEQGCPMHELSDLADGKVENTKQGATLTFTAKKPEDAQKVQALVQKLSEHRGDCKGQACMRGGKGGMMKHGDKGDKGDKGGMMKH